MIISDKVKVRYEIEVNPSGDAAKQDIKDRLEMFIKRIVQDKLTSHDEASLTVVEVVIMEWK